MPQVSTASRFCPRGKVFIDSWRICRDVKEFGVVLSITSPGVSQTIGYYERIVEYAILLQIELQEACVLMI